MSHKASILTTKPSVRSGAVVRGFIKLIISAGRVLPRGANDRLRVWRNCDEVSECKHKMILSNLPSDAKIRKTALCSKLCRTGNSLSDRSYVVWFVLPSVKKKGNGTAPAGEKLLPMEREAVEKGTASFSTFYHVVVTFRRPCPCLSVRNRRPAFADPCPACRQRA